MHAGRIRRGGDDLVGHPDRRTGAARRGNADDQLGATAVQRLQALADVGEADAVVALGHEAHAVVHDVDRELAVDDLGVDLDPAAGGLRLQAVLDRVLHERLQHHRRKYRGPQALRHVDRGLEAFLHAHRHDLQERAREIDLLAERRPATLAHLRHRRAQVADEALLHPGRARGIGADQLVDACERVEQEMRLDLRLQRLHPRLERRPLELLGLGAMRGLPRRELRSALAAGHDLDDDRDDDEQEERLGVVQDARDDQAQEEDDQQRLPRDDREPVEESPPQRHDHVPEVAERLPRVGRLHGRGRRAAVGDAGCGVCGVSGHGMPSIASSCRRAD